MSGFITTHACPPATATVPLGRIDPLERYGLPDAFFQARSGDVMAAYGVAVRAHAPDAQSLDRVFEALETTPPHTEGPPPPAVWFGGFAFDAASSRDERWSGFGAALWIMPRHLVWSSEGETFLTTFGDAPPLTTSPAAVSATPERIAFESDRDGWMRAVLAAQAWIAEARGTKVVLARTIDLRADQPFHVLRALRTLCARNRGSTVFCLRAPDGGAFLGATPETLVRRSGAFAQTEALAGTVLEGDEARLLGSEQIRREHDAVVDGIRAAILTFAREVEIEREPRVFPVRHLRHLRTGVRFQLPAHASLSTVVRALHPTPAVGGTPREGAFSFLREHERIDRGFYAGPVGWVAGDRAELSVGLRSAWVKGNDARLFVGAGLVAGCDADAEWRETETKSRPMREALAEGLT